MTQESSRLDLSNQEKLKAFFESVHKMDGFEADLALNALLEAANRKLRQLKPEREKTTTQQFLDWLLEEHDELAVISDLKCEGQKAYVVTYAFGRSKGPATITFSRSAWEGEYEPQISQMAILEGVQWFRGGWRAYRAYPIYMSDFRIRKEDLETKTD